MLRWRCRYLPENNPLPAEYIPPCPTADIKLVRGRSSCLMEVAVSSSCAGTSSRIHCCTTVRSPLPPLVRKKVSRLCVTQRWYSRPNSPKHRSSVPLSPVTGEITDWWSSKLSTWLLTAGVKFYVYPVFESKGKLDFRNIYDSHKSKIT